MQIYSQTHEIVTLSSALLQNFKILIHQLMDSGFKIFYALNFTIFSDPLLFGIGFVIKNSEKVKIPA